MNGHRQQYERLHVIEFTSERKRMSVLLRDLSNNKLLLYTKGADDVIMTRIKSGNNMTYCILNIQMFP
jgi:magnesium-transporting ATPase (P-type)